MERNIRDVARRHPPLHLIQPDRKYIGNMCLFGIMCLIGDESPS